jgi:hypothetical protein
LKLLANAQPSVIHLDDTTGSGCYHCNDTTTVRNFSDASAEHRHKTEQRARVPVFAIPALPPDFDVHRSSSASSLAKIASTVGHFDPLSSFN